VTTNTRRHWRHRIRRPMLSSLAWYSSPHWHRIVKVAMRAIYVSDCDACTAVEETNWYKFELHYASRRSHGENSDRGTKSARAERSFVVDTPVRLTRPLSDSDILVL